MDSVNSPMGGDNDLIVALSSGQLPSPIAVIRASGKGSIERALSFIRFVTSRKSIKPGVIFRSQVIDLRDQQILDEPSVVFYKSPKSYTGEDSLEVYAHGGRYIVQKILEQFYRQGFRQAEPGEFTRRAFLNEKMDLTEAEGIHELISANSHQQWLAGRGLASGKLRHAVESLRDELIGALAFLAARIDFPDEEETSQVEWAHVDERVENVAKKITDLMGRYRSGKIAREGFKVALVGKPNAGKSTLLNTLLGTERSIVTPIPGTTRDFIEENCLINGRLLCLYDTAGLRESDDEVEKIGIERSWNIAKDADLILYLHAANESIDASLLLHGVDGQQLFVQTKSDLLTSGQPLGQGISISCLTGQGLEELKRRLISYVDESLLAIQESSFITNTRHFTALEHAKSCLDEFKAARQEQAYEEVLSLHLEKSSQCLAEIIGHIHTDDVLDQLFRSFCVGK